MQSCLGAMQCGSSSLLPVVPSLVLVTENLGRDAQKWPETLVREEVVFIFHDKAVARVDLTNAVILSPQGRQFYNLRENKFYQFIAGYWK